MFLEKQDKAEGVSDYNNFFVPTRSDKNKGIFEFPDNYHGSRVYE
jgi:hypothetical protein